MLASELIRRHTERSTALLQRIQRPSQHISLIAAMACTLKLIPL